MKVSAPLLGFVKISHVQSDTDSSYAYRNTTIELVRILAALGVIAAHISDSKDETGRAVAALMPMRVPFFYSISLFLFVVSLSRSTPLQVAGRVWRRLLVPYLSWTFLYVLLIEIKAFFAHGNQALVWWRILFYGESSIQLYFLPTLFMLQTMALGIYLALLSKNGQRYMGWLLLAGAIIYYICGAHCRCTGMGEPTYFIGYAIYLVAAFGLAFITANYRIGTAGALVGGCLVVLVVCCSGAGYKMLVFGYSLLMPLGGVGSLLLATGLRSHWRCNWLSTVTSLSFGIYLCHPLFIELFDVVRQCRYTMAISYVFTNKVLEIILVFILSGGFVLLLRQIKHARQLLLGEQ